MIGKLEDLVLDSEALISELLLRVHCVQVVDLYRIVLFVSFGQVNL